MDILVQNSATDCFFTQQNAVEASEQISKACNNIFKTNDILENSLELEQYLAKERWARTDTEKAAAIQSKFFPHDISAFHDSYDYHRTALRQVFDARTQGKKECNMTQTRTFSAFAEWGLGSPFYLSYLSSPGIEHPPPSVQCFCQSFWVIFDAHLDQQLGQFRGQCVQLHGLDLEGSQQDS